MDMSRVLSIPYDRHMSSLSVMDAFEKRENGQKLYDTLKLENAFTIWTERYGFKTSLYIQRMLPGTDFIPSPLTFSQFKKEIGSRNCREKSAQSYKLLKCAYDGLTHLLSSDSDGDDFFFPIPIQFNAQNSSNRSGYGNQYYGRDLVYEGTKYGETTRYLIIGAQYKLYYNLKP